jgi:hypothetical protein
MARIERYTPAHTGRITSELQSQLANVITPEEAAAVELAKTQAISDVIAAGQDITETLISARAEEEYSSAVAQYETAMSSLDTGIENMPAEVDKDGQPVYNPGKIVKTEAAARSKIASDVRAGLTTVRAKKAFDQHLRESGIRRTNQYQAADIEREREFRRGVLITDMDALLGARNYEGAELRSSQALRIGTITATEHAKNMTSAGRRRDSDYVSDALLNPTAKSLNETLASVRKGTYPDGRQFSSDPDVMAQYGNALRSKLDSYERERDEAIKNQQDMNYIAAIIPSMNKDITPEDIVNLGLQGKLSRVAVDALISNTQKEGIDDPHEKTHLTHAVMSMGSMRIENYEEARNKLTMEVFASSLTDDTKFELIKQLNDDSQIFGEELYKNSKRAAYASINGFQEDQLSAMMGRLSSHYRETAVVATEFQNALAHQARTLGLQRIRDGELEEWVKENEVVFRLRAQESVLSKVGVVEPMPENPEAIEAWKVNARNEIRKWIEDGVAVGDNNRQKMAMDAAGDVERLTQIKLYDVVRIQ